MSRQKLNQSGAVAMLSVTIFSLIITVVATAYISSVISQQRNALNYDQGTRAYYAAESGVQDTVRDLRLPAHQSANKNTDCTPWENSQGTIGGDRGYNLRYTCQLVTVKPTELTGQLQPGGNLNATMKLETDNPAPGPYKLVLRWSKTSDETNPQVLYPRGLSDQKLLGRTTQWNANGNTDFPMHAILRASVIDHTATNFTRANIQQRVLYLNPTPPSSKDANPGLALGQSQASQQDQLITNAACYPSDSVPANAGYNGFACQATLELNSSYDLRNQALYLRLGSVYRSTSFSVQLLKDEQPLQLKNGQAIIDVTGKSGDSTFRRVKQTVSIGGYKEDHQLDAGLVSAEGICKLFTVGASDASFLPECNPLTDGQQVPGPPPTED